MWEGRVEVGFHMGEAVDVTTCAVGFVEDCVRLEDRRLGDIAFKIWMSKSHRRNYKNLK